mgnify:FL=1
MSGEELIKFQCKFSIKTLNKVVETCTYKVMIGLGSIWNIFSNFLEFADAVKAMTGTHFPTITSTFTPFFKLRRPKDNAQHILNFKTHP